MEKNSEKTIRILLMDSQSAFRDGLVMQLNREKDFAAVAETADSTPVVELIRRHASGILLCDVGEDAPQGFPRVNEIRKSCGAGFPIIAISDIRDETAVREFIGSGGAGYLLKTCRFEEYIEAIREAIGGNKYVCRELAAEILSKKTVMKYDPEGQKTYNAYTRKRKRVIRHFLEEESYKAIADCLGIETGTIEYHIKKSRGDFNVHCDKDLLL
jgi:DNA-binding NarL/FixJ family response regulator